MASGTNDLAGAAKQMGEWVKNTKTWQKHGKMIKQMLHEWIGPLGLVIILSQKFLFGLVAILKASDLVRRGLEAWSRVQMNLPSMAKMLGSMSEAKRRLNELARMAASGPFKFDALVEANRRLHYLTRGAFAGKKAMEQVADAAAAAGVSPQMAAEAIGEVMDALGKGETGAMQLRALGEMGILSRTAADELENMALAGAGAEAVMAALQARLAANKGAAKALGDTLYGLSQQLASEGDKQLAGVGQLFSEAEAAGMRAGIKMLQTLGPIVIDLLRPLAVAATWLAKIGEALANVAAFEPIKNALSTVLRLLVAISAVFTARGAYMFLRDILPIANWLLKMGIAAGKATGAFKLLAVAVVAFGKSLYKTLGGVTGFVALLAGLAADMGVFGKLKGGKEGDFLEKSAEDIKEQNEKVRKLVQSGGGIGQKAEALSVAHKAAREAHENVQAKLEDTQPRLGKLISNIAMGVGAGKIIGGRWGALAGGIVGLGQSLYEKHISKEELRKAREGDREAQANLTAAYSATALDPAQFLNDPDYARAKAEAEKKMLDISLKMGEAMHIPDVKERNRRMAELEADYAEVANGLQPQQIAKAFNERMAQTGAKIQAMNAIANATGNRAMAMEAKRMEAGMIEEQRKKELIFGNMDANKAANIAKMEGLGALQDMLMQNGRVIASSRAAVGGGVAEATGGIPLEFQKVIDEIRAIRGVVEEQEQAYQVPEELK